MDGVERNGKWGGARIGVTVAVAGRRPWASDTPLCRPSVSGLRAVPTLVDEVSVL